MRRLSIVIPAYNEEAFIGVVLDKVLAVDLEGLGFEGEIVVVNDGSKDGTAEVAARHSGVIVMSQPHQGKGRAVQNGIKASTGDFVIVQDADLEYDPQDYRQILERINGGAQAVYGSRIIGQIAGRGWTVTPGRHPKQGLGYWTAGVILSCWTAVLYGRWISDTLTAYKVYPREFFNQAPIRTHGFETDHEITAKLLRNGVQIEEVAISYSPRSVAEGKKIRAVDGLIAVWTLLRFRFGS